MDRDSVSGCLRVWCDIEYTDEYAHPEGYAVAEKVCQRCGKREVAWVGPDLEDFPDDIEHEERSAVTGNDRDPIDLGPRYS